MEEITITWKSQTLRKPADPEETQVEVTSLLIPPHVGPAPEDTQNDALKQRVSALENELTIIKGQLTELITILNHHQPFQEMQIVCQDDV